MYILPCTPAPLVNPPLPFVMPYTSVYGPVRSWRYGRSLGIDPIGVVSTCSFNCVYCQLGEIQHHTTARQIFIPTEKIVRDLQVVNLADVDVVTLSGSGEPTQALNIGEILTAAKQIAGLPMVVLTEKMGTSLPLLGGLLDRMLSARLLNKYIAVYSERMYNGCMLNLTYEYKLIPTDAQRETIDHWLEICRKVYNFALRERKDWVNSRKCDINSCSIRQEYIIPADAPRPTFARQCKTLSSAKKSIPELKLPHTHVLQQALRQLEAAFVAMWERGHGFPRFKKRMRSFVFPQLNLETVRHFDAADEVNLPKIGWVKIHLSRPIPQGFEVKQIRIVKRASGYYAMLTLQCDVEVPQISAHGHSLGIDLGLEDFLATSDGDLVDRPRFFVDGQRKLKSLQRQLKRKKKGSLKFRQLHHRIAKHHEYISNARKDFHFKTADYLCDQAGSIFAEDLNLKAMSAGILSKHTLDAGFGQFLNILGHVCFKRGVYFARVDPDGTSQTCPRCQTHTGKKELSEPVHKCPECGYETNRDVAAAQVVLQRGYTAVGHIAMNFGEGKLRG